MDQERKDRILEKLAFDWNDAKAIGRGLADDFSFAGRQAQIGADRLGRGAADLLRGVAQMKQQRAAQRMDHVANITGQADKPGYVPMTERMRAAMEPPAKPAIPSPAPVGPLLAGTDTRR